MSNDDPTATAHGMDDTLRRALGEIGDAALPPVAFDDLDVAVAPVVAIDGAARSRRRARLATGLGAAAAAAVVVVALVVGGDDSQRTSTDAVVGAVAPPATAWEPAAAPPLSARDNATVAWTGREILVVGGDNFVCPANADCDLPTEPAFADGAAYDPATDTWRPIADAPFGFTWGLSAALGDDVWIVAQDRRSAEEEQTPALLRYSVGEDSWSQVEVPGGVALAHGLVATPAGLVLYATSDEFGAAGDLLFDPRSGEWGELPEDPLGLAFDRHMVLVGDQLHLFDHELVDQPGSEQPAITRTARLDLPTMQWTRGADSEILGAEPWLVEGSLLVNPQVGCADGGETNGYGRCIPYGGVYDAATDTWSELPGAPGGKYDLSSGAIGTNRAVVYAAGHPLFDAATRTWLDMPALGGAADDGTLVEFAITTAGTDAFAFGGVRFAGGAGNGELLGEAWIWRSGRTPAPVPAQPPLPNPDAITEPTATPEPTPGAAGSEPPQDPAVGVIEPLECPPGAECIVGFEVDGQVYQVLCQVVKDTAVSDEVLAVGDGTTGYDRMVAIDEVDPTVMVAARGGGCDGTTAWQAVRPPVVDASSAEEALAFATAVCEVVETPSPADRCDEGGAATWATTSGNFGQGFGYFPSYVEGVERAAADDPDRVWRTDPVEVIRAHVTSPERGVCPEGLYRTCRVLVADPVLGGDVVRIEGVLQWEFQGMFETFPLAFTIERLVSGGDTWWLTGYEEQVSTSGTDRAAFDAMAECCPVVVLEVGSGG